MSFNARKTASVTTVLAIIRVYAVMDMKEVTKKALVLILTNAQTIPSIVQAL